MCSISHELLLVLKSSLKQRHGNCSGRTFTPFLFPICCKSNIAYWVFLFHLIMYCMFHVQFTNSKQLTANKNLHRSHVDSRVWLDAWMLNFDGNDVSRVTSSCTMNLGQRRRGDWMFFKAGEQIVNTLSQIICYDAFDIRDWGLRGMLMQNFHGINILGRQQIV